MNVREWVQYACDSCNVSELGRTINIKWNGRFTSCAGRANFSLNLIELSSKIWPLMNEEQQIETIVHETCHIIDRSNGNFSRRLGGHDISWQELMLDCGITPKRYHKVDTSSIKKRRGRQARFQFYCACPSDPKRTIGPTQYKRLRGGAEYTCRTCKEPIYV